MHLPPPGHVCGAALALSWGCPTQVATSNKAIAIRQILFPEAETDELSKATEFFFLSSLLGSHTPYHEEWKLSNLFKLALLIAAILLHKKISSQFSTWGDLLRCGLSFQCFHRHIALENARGRHHLSDLTLLVMTQSLLSHDWPKSPKTIFLSST